MSLADLYRTDSKDLLQDDSSDDDGEFVLEEEDDEEERGSDSSNASDNDDGNGNSDISKAAETETAAVSEQRKRRIDDIWKEMNSPAEEKQAKESVHIETDNDESEAGKQQKEVDDGSVEDKESTEAESVPKKSPTEDKAGTETDAPRKRRRPVSKFSKMAEMVEQRRAKRENTLDTARRQWTGFVDSQGIRDDLSRANKDGYVERQDFLRRVDERTYQNSRSQQK
ncbi:hypothetical protein H4S06_005383 [Coemansia sp. BCRC 34490]|nr:hypothetical protein H4S06_005383 [Coemansia sp. BCRC 34490]